MANEKKYVKSVQQVKGLTETRVYAHEAGKKQLVAFAVHPATNEGAEALRYVNDKLHFDLWILVKEAGNLLHVLDGVPEKDAHYLASQVRVESNEPVSVAHLYTEARKAFLDAKRRAEERGAKRRARQGAAAKAGKPAKEAA